MLVAQTKQISTVELEDKIYASWLGQIVGNIYGLPHENAYIEEPGPEAFPYGYGRNLKKLKELNGGYSDDDTDFEYIYFLQMEKHGIEPTYAQLAEAWKYHVRDKVWLANRAALGLMHAGLTPPATGWKEYNPHWFQIDPQLINEIWAVTSPGMLRYAVDKSEWAARITNDDWGVEPTMFYAAMYSAAFFEKDIHKLIAAGYQYLPENGRFRRAIDDMKSLYSQYPDNWKKARQILCREYYYNEPDETRTIWNSILNASCAVLAMLYGDGNFQRTLDLACAMGFDADNQAATLCGLFGVMNGTTGLPRNLLFPVEGWALPFNDSYKNITRYDIPDGQIKDIARRTALLAGKIILKNGGYLKNNTYTIPDHCMFTPPSELTQAPLPVMNAGEVIHYALPVSGNSENIKWELNGVLPNGLQFKDGAFSGMPMETGRFPLTVTLTSPGIVYTQNINLTVRPENLACSAAKILTNVPETNTQVRDSMWYSYGRALYATTVDVIRDGKVRGEQSVYYTILNNIPYPKIDYFGYRWEEEQTVGHIGFHIGAIEENGGWYASLTVQYMDEKGYWINAGAISIEPPLSNPVDIYRQPHFIEYFISFKPVKTKAVRIIGDATLYEHWHRNSMSVSPFVSITELSVYKPFF
ncbi:MAG: ADP-ribosylglycohydrolase family protein [Tannerellaceae bacterium]|nr:ADP-ribosylglycohydrolase family protein [Tannerellaceae bacterium]